MIYTACHLHRKGYKPSALQIYWTTGPYYTQNNHPQSIGFGAPSIQATGCEEQPCVSDLSRFFWSSRSNTSSLFEFLYSPVEFIRSFRPQGFVFGLDRFGLDHLHSFEILSGLCGAIMPKSLILVGIHIYRKTSGNKLRRRAESESELVSALSEEPSTSSRLNG